MGWQNKQDDMIMTLSHELEVTEGNQKLRTGKPLSQESMWSWKSSLTLLQQNTIQSYEEVKNPDPVCVHTGL